MKTTKIETYLERYPEETSPGWQAINASLEKLYPGITPKHVLGGLPMIAGGTNVLEGINIYKSNAGGTEHYHYISCGLSDLHRDEAYADQEYSGFGFEFTFRLKPFKEDKEWPTWPTQLMQNLARYVVNSGNIFENYHVIPIRGGIRVGTDNITALIFYEDMELGTIDTPHGKVQFLQMFGISQKEYEKIKSGAKEEFLAVIDLINSPELDSNTLLITDLERN